MHVGILGSGFGLYGYLPALCGVNLTPILLEKTKEIFAIKVELQPFLHKILFLESEKELVAHSRRLIIARKPEQQADLLLHNNGFAGIEHLYLEKPLTPSLITRSTIIRILGNRSYSIAYLFFYTNWFFQIQEMLESHSNLKINIEWKIPTQDSTWKTNPLEGGGLLLNYGIHFLAMFWKLGIKPSNIVLLSSTGIIFLAKDENNNEIEIKAGYFKKQLFSVGITNANIKQSIFCSDTPFGKRHMSGRPDARIDLIVKYLQNPIDELSTSAKKIEDFISQALKNKVLL